MRCVLPGLLLFCIVWFAGCQTTPEVPIVPAPALIVVPDDAPTIRQAMEAAGRGTVVQVKAGLYEESVSLHDAVSLRGAGAGNTILRGGQADTPVLRAVGCEQGVVEGLSIQYAGESDNYAVHLVDASIEIRECVISGASLSGVLIEGARSAPILEGVLIHDNAECGVLFRAGAKGRIEQCTSWLNGEDGIRVSAAAPQVIRNTLVGNLGAGIRVDGDAAPELTANIAAGNRWGISGEPAQDAVRHGRPRLQGNLCWKNMDGDYKSVRQGNTDIVADPQFVDGDAGDFRPLSGAPVLLQDGTMRGAWPLAPEGTDEALGRTIHVPRDVARIQEAIDLARPGDTIQVGAGTYRESLRLRSGIILRGVSRADVVVRGGSDKVPVLLVENCAEATVESMTFVFDGKGANHVALLVGSTVSIRDCVFSSGTLSGIVIRGANSAPVISNCVVQDNRESGIVALDGAHGDISFNVVAHNGLNGVFLTDGAAPDVYRNTIVDNGSAGVWVRDGVAPRVEYNITVGNEWGITADSGTVGRRNGMPALSNNIAWDNRSGNFILVQRGSGDLEQDPMFRHRAGRDYRVGPSSPAVKGRKLVAGAYDEIADKPMTWRVPAQVPTIQAAIDAAWEGDEVLVAPGRYNEALRLAKGVTVRAGDPVDTHLLPADPAHPVVLARRVSDALLEGFTITYTGEGKVYAVDLEFAEVTVRNCTISGASLSGVLVRGGAPVLERLMIHDNAQSGVHITEHAAGRVERCTIVGNQLNGIAIDRGANPLVVGNTIVNNGEVGIWVRDGSRAQLERNIIVGNQWGISAEGHPPIYSDGAPVLRDNCAWDNTVANYETKTTSGGESGGPVVVRQLFQLSPTDIEADPQFVNPKDNDYRLRPGSPAILPDGTPRGAWPVAPAAPDQI